MPEQVVVSPCSTGSLAAMAMRRGQLVLAAEGHQHGARADGGVEPLGQALLAADVQVADHGFQLLAQTLRRQTGACQTWRRQRCAHQRVLARRRWSSGTRGRGQRWSCRSRPCASRVSVGDGGNDSGLEVFLVRRTSMKRLGVLWRNDHGHALLALRNGQLGAVQTLVLVG